MVKAWLWQRLTALFGFVFLPFLFYVVMQAYTGSWNQSELLCVLHQPWLMLLHSLLAMALLVHVFLGLRVIAQDYLHRPALLLTAHALNVVLSLSLLITWLALIWI